MIESVPSTKSQKLVEVQQSNNVKKQQKSEFRYTEVYLYLLPFLYKALSRKMEKFW